MKMGKWKSQSENLIMLTANFQGERGHKRRDRYLHFNTNKKNWICIIILISKNILSCHISLFQIPYLSIYNEDIPPQWWSAKRAPFLTQWKILQIIKGKCGAFVFAFWHLKVTKMILMGCWSMDKVEGSVFCEGTCSFWRRSNLIKDLKFCATYNKYMGNPRTLQPGDFFINEFKARLWQTFFFQSRTTYEYTEPPSGVTAFF